MLSQPVKYLFATGFTKFLYPYKKKGILTSAKTFFGKKMNIVLPAGTDIYLVGGKSHDSEIRLAKFLINNLSAGDCFFDVGAHFGYFSLLASEIVGSEGSVISFEASKSTFGILEENVKNNKNVRAFNKAVSDTVEALIFYEFPVLYSEYNSMNIRQFENENWFSKFKPEKAGIDAILLDEVIQDLDVKPKMIKIDVEGAEYRVLKGVSSFISSNYCIIVMEYLNVKKHNQEHQKAKKLLENLGFTSYIISQSGGISKIDDIDTYLIKNSLESDNIVFCKE